MKLGVNAKLRKEKWVSVDERKVWPSITDGATGVIKLQHIITPINWLPSMYIEYVYMCTYKAYVYTHTYIDAHKYIHAYIYFFILEKIA